MIEKEFRLDIVRDFLNIFVILKETQSYKEVEVHELNDG